MPVTLQTLLVQFERFFSNISEDGLSEEFVLSDELKRGLEDFSDRPFVYHVFGKSLKAHIGSSNAPSLVMASACKWIIDVLPRYQLHKAAVPIPATWTLTSIRMFSLIRQERKHVSNFTHTKFVKNALALENSADLIRFLLVRPPPVFEDSLPRVEKAQQFLVDIQLLPYEKPDDADMLQMESLVWNVKTRSSTYPLVCKLLVDLFRRHDLLMDSRTALAVRVSIVEKLAWWLQELEAMIQQWPPSSLMLQAMLRQINWDLGLEYQEMGLIEVMQTLLDSAIETILEPVIDDDEEAVAAPQYFLGSTERFNFESAPVKEDELEERLFLANDIDEPADCSFLSVWLQVDPEINRLVTGPSDMQDAMREVLTSLAPGTLVMSSTGFLWQIDGIARTTQAEEPQGRNHVDGESQKAQAFRNEELFIPFESIRKYSWGRLSELSDLNCESGPLQLYFENYTLSFFEKSSSVDESRAGQTTQVMNHTEALDAEISSQMCFLTLFCGQIHRFFPISFSDVKQIVRFLGKILNKASIREEAHLKETLNVRLDRVRLNMLEEIKASQQWITSLITLDAVLGRLTTSLNTERCVFDLELLFNSCKRERELLTETIKRIKVLWKRSRLDSNRLRLLTILDRLLNKSLLSMGSRDFESVKEWLPIIDNQVETENSALCYRMFLRVQMRAREIMRAGSCRGFSEWELKEHVENLENFGTWRSMYVPDD